MVVVETSRGRLSRRASRTQQPTHNTEAATTADPAMTGLKSDRTSTASTRQREPFAPWSPPSSIRFRMLPFRASRSRKQREQQ